MDFEDEPWDIDITRYRWAMSSLVTNIADIYTVIVLSEQSKCVDSLFTSDKQSLTVYNIYKSVGASWG